MSGNCISRIKMAKVKKVKFNDGWCFAMVNGWLAEIHFSKKYGIFGHCYVKRKEYTTKKEQKMIEADVKKCQFTCRGGYYFDKLRGIKQKIVPMDKVFPEIKKYEKNK